MKNSKNNFAKLFSAIDKFKIYLFIIAVIVLIAIPFLHLKQLHHKYNYKNNKLYYYGFRT